MPFLKLPRIVLGVLLAGVLAACAASQNPIGPESEAASEPRLAGTWQYDGDKGGWDYLHIFPSEDGKALEIIAINGEEKAWAILSGYVTASGDRRYVNLRLANASPAIMADVQKQGQHDRYPYSFVAFRFDGDNRLLFVYPIEQLYAAVKAGRLAGATAGDYDVSVSDTSANIAAEMAAVSDAELFKDPGAYRRISAAASP